MSIFDAMLSDCETFLCRYFVVRDRILSFTLLLSIIFASNVIAADPPPARPPRLLPPASNPSNQPNPQEQAKAQEIYKLSRAARLAEADGDWSKALELWQSIRKERKDDYAAYGGIRRALTSLSRFDEALAFIDASIKIAASGTMGIDPATMAADKIEVLFAAGRDQAAMTEIDRQISIYKGLPSIYRNIANVLYSQRHGDEAIALLKRARNDSNDKHLFSREIAQFAEVRMDWETAVAEYLLNLEEATENLSYVTGTLGDIMNEPGGDSLVLKTIDLRLKSTDKRTIAPFLELKANLLFRSRDYANSLVAYRQLDQTGSSDRKILLEIAQKLAEEDEPILALSAYNEFLKGDVPTETRYRTLLKIAKTWESLSKIDSAEASSRLVLVPGAPLDAIIEANYLLGKYSVLKRQPPAVSREYFEKALSLARKGSVAPGVNLEEVEIALALTYQLEARFDLARKELEKVVKLSGTRANAAPQARFELARLAFRQGDLEEAKKQADALLAADPSAEMSNEVLELASLLDGLKESPEVLKLLGQADMLALLGKPKEASMLLDSLASKGANSRIVEEALWRKIDLQYERGETALVLKDLDRLIAIDGEVIRKDKALYEAGVLAQTVLSDQIRARKYYDNLLLDFPNSPLAERVRKLAKSITIEEN